MAAQSNIYTGNIPTVSGESELGVCVCVYLGGGVDSTVVLSPDLTLCVEWDLVTRNSQGWASRLVPVVSMFGIVSLLQEQQ